MPTDSTIVGTTIGDTSTARSVRVPGNDKRTRATDASVPSEVASAVTISAASKLRTVASRHDRLDQYAPYQRSDNVVGGNSRKSPPLNDMTTTSRLGSARYTSTRPVASQRSGWVRSPVIPTPCRGRAVG